jgi:hypothetical protein
VISAEKLKDALLLDELLQTATIKNLPTHLRKKRN